MSIQQEDASCKLNKEALGENEAADTLILDSRLQICEKVNFCLVVQSVAFC